MATAGGPPTLRRAVALMSVSSALIPLAGLVTAPLLARALSTDGRGELAAATAPAGLMVAAATLGLPDALTFLLAKQPVLTRRAVLLASAMTLALGMVCVGVTWLSLPFLSGGDAGLGDFIMLATLVTVPALIVNVLRGAAMGRQMWMAVTVEKLVSAGSRVIGLIILFTLGELTVLSAILVSVPGIFISALAYLFLFRAPEEKGSVDLLATEETRKRARVLRMLLSFGSRVWLGSVAGMLLARTGQLLITPLSSVEDLGLYSVAVTVSDVPFIIAFAIQNALFGVNSRNPEAHRLTGAARLTLLAATAGCAAMAASLPFWITLLFGDDFGAALVPTLLLLVSALVSIPGIMASTGLSAWGRPGLRSIGQLASLVLNIVMFVVLVPPLGVYGACLAAIATALFSTVFVVVAAGRVMQVRASEFFVIRGRDFRAAGHEVRVGVVAIGRRMPSRRRASRDNR